jgi:hypothetical protein
MYNKAEQLGSLKAKMRLAMLTGTPSAKADSEPDSPELISKFQAALTEIEKEFK